LLCVGLNHRNRSDTRQDAFLELTKENAYISLANWLEAHPCFTDVDSPYALGGQLSEQSAIVSIRESGASTTTHQCAATLDAEQLMGENVWVLKVFLSPGINVDEDMYAKP